MSRPALLMTLMVSAFSAQSAALAVLSASSAAVSAAPTQVTFAAKDAGEAIATITASCEKCDWGVEGREAATLRISLDGKYSQHLMLVRGDKPSEYRITLGRVIAGTHTV